MWWQRILERRRRKRDTAGPDIAFWRLQSMFNNFRRILELNNAILEGVADMDRALGGEYIFDRAYLEQSVRRIASNVHHVVYSLNALTGNRHVPLYDRYQDIRTILDDILAGDVRALAGAPVLPLHAVGWELEPLVGIAAVCMAELHNHAGLPVARGCVLTTEGAGLLLKHAAPPRNDRPAAQMNTLRRGQAAAVLQSVHSVFTPPSTNELQERAALLRAQLTAEIAALLDGSPGFGLRADIASVEALVDDASWPDAAGACRAVIQLSPAPGGGIDAAHILPPVRTSQADAAAPTGPRLHRPGQATAEAYADLLEEVLRTLPGDPHMAVLLTRTRPAAVKGTVTSRYFCSSPQDARNMPGRALCQDALVIEAVHTDVADHADGSRSPASGSADRYMLQRTYPFAPMQSEIAPRQPGVRFADGRLATSVTEEGRGRGSALLRQQDMRALAETTMAMERMLGMPIMLEWELGEDGRCRILHAAPYLPPSTDADTDLQEQLADELADELAGATILVRGGHMVQSGVVAGKVVHLEESMRAEDFPVGAIAVTKVASPRLTPFLQRASAIICENGTIAGHLATVARELRLPAVFGMPDATMRLAEGSEVTLDAGELTLYAGVLPALLQFSTAGADLYPTAPEYHTLRRLLRFISPLHLVNPEAPEFAPEGCRTFHDLIHYCHEKSVDELAHFQERRPGLGAIRTRRMQLGRPMDLRVLDIANGLAENASAHPVADDVLSRPFAAFLDGLLREEAWDTAPVALGIRDVISSMPHSMSMLGPSANTLGENLAIISRDYVNISLRLGYHFSVVDAYLGPDLHRNHVYFRFAGGLADPDRRNRRARFIRSVLEDMGFKVVLKGDLVVGSLKQEDTHIMRSALFVLGALTAYARQRDTGLHSETDMHALYEAFHTLFLRHYDRLAPEYDIMTRLDRDASPSGQPRNERTEARA